MNDETMYQPPALVDAGDFAKVTMGSGGDGYEPDFQCLVLCD